MTEVLHTNIFFFITGISVIVISVIFIILLFQVIRTIKSIRRILTSIERGTEIISEDMQSIRNHFTTGGLIGGIMSLFRGITEDEPPPRKKTTRKKRRGTSLKITDVTK